MVLDTVYHRHRGSGGPYATLTGSMVYRVHEYCIPKTMVLQISQTQLPILVIMEYLVI